MSKISIGYYPVVHVIWATFVASVKTLFLHFFGRLDTERGEKLIESWWRTVLRAGRITLQTEGLGVDRSLPYVFMSNHASSLDIPAIFGAIYPMRLRMISKAEIGDLPFFGSALRKLDFIFLNRKNPRKALRQLDEARTILQSGVSVWMAPEGTRTRTGKLGPFKRGGFNLAIQLGVPIVPVWISGSMDIMPPRYLRFAYGGTIGLVFGTPIPTAGLGKADLAELSNKVRDAILELSPEPKERVDGGDAFQGTSDIQLKPGFVRRLDLDSPVLAIEKLRELNQR